MSTLHEPTITISDLAKELSCSDRTIRREMKRRNGKLVYFKIAKNYQIYRWSVKEWIESRTRGGRR